MKQFLLGAAAALTLLGGTAAVAQYNRGNPLDDFLRGLTTRTGNSVMNCNLYRNLDRDGDIRYLRMDCRATGQYRR